jgi:carboxymethylenebutenolidase
LRSNWSRRHFVVTSLAAGFALATRPIPAQTAITTDTEGLDAGDVSIPVKDGSIPGYRAMPQRQGPFATVLVIQEVFGVHEHIKDICRRLAKAGYFAVAPALYARQGDTAQMASIDDILKVVAQVPDAEVAADLDATVAWAQATGKADITRLGVTGFCWGGRQVWLYAAHNPRLKAGIAWYGPLGHSDSPLTPVGPLDLASQLTVPVLGLYGGDDPNIPVDQIEDMKAKLAAAHKPCEIVIYPDTPHGFNADYRPSYRPEAAKDGWNRLLAWFRKNGVA